MVHDAIRRLHQLAHAAISGQTHRGRNVDMLGVTHQVALLRRGLVPRQEKARRVDTTSRRASRAT